MTVDATYRKAVDTVRLLAADGVEKADSGHPGMPMGCADFAFTLWYQFLRHNPADPKWLGRDRFVLSAGHGSMLIYSLLHLFGYDVTLDDLKQFRQWQSKTPGHPEYGHTPGVEVTTGPLSTGLCTSVGLAMGAKQMAARLENEDLFDQRIFVLASDGDMMEGGSHEAGSLAGHQKLDNLIVFYDDNSISIDGSTALAFSEDVGKRFEAYGWQVTRVNGQDVAQIAAAVKDAIAAKGKPKLIVGKTTIGFGAPKKAGSEKSHGAPLGKEELAGAKKAFGFPENESFYVPADVRQLCTARIAELQKVAAEWDRKLAAFRTAKPEKAVLMDQLLSKAVPANILEELLKAVPEKDVASRASNGAIMQKVAALVPSLTGGSADLNPSTVTYLTADQDFSPANRAARNIRYGVREMVMGLSANGLALYGAAVPFTATFAVFSDFMKPALRLASIQKLRVVFVYTHDSIFVGEDGPTHQPIEHLLMCRSIPGMTVIRPAESHEVAHAWAVALKSNGPVVLFLTRQNLKNFTPEQCANIQLARGAYVLSEDPGFDLVLIGTGSEVTPAEQTAQLLRQGGRKVRVVSMPSWELFDRQDQAYRDSVLPPAVTARVSIEAGTTIGWDKYVGSKGLKIGLDHFGDSAPYKILIEKYGLAPEAMAARIGKHFGG
ncbi:MAG: transketolase [Lentisphaerae bacterium RIFOXYB12_FULL_65_16]|nr:MAG: transketolase [Lentisphaerae bacterium RIFOXYA12_64_32]OGV94025.1 MAG: transketolase [Lentisphaerae bacterium RIFOXYB12_FULL_65_16]